jgi:mannan endo-1,4-beta-mannosidase
VVVVEEGAFNVCIPPLLRLRQQIYGRHIVHLAFSSMTTNLKSFVKQSLLLFFWGFTSSLTVIGQGIQLIDKHATPETKALFNNLHKLSKDHTLFGHQHATEYGHGWEGETDRSDVKSVTGSHPAVIGIDLGGFTHGNTDYANKYKERVKKTVEDTYNRGGVVTISWHFSNPVSGGGFYWVDTISKPAVKYLIPGGEAHQLYKQILKGIADWAMNAKGKDGKLVPMIFRPYHELDGDWFWWGRAHCTIAEFTSLWKFTVTYLRDSLKVHNFIYAFSPDNKFMTEAQYLERYPGDEWVDMVGIDNYGDMGRNGSFNLPAAISKLKIISDYATKSGKLAAFTETGLESIPDTKWWTGTLLKVMKAEKMRLCYVLVWRNDRQSPTHYYAPFPGQVSVPDFLAFYNDPYTLFEKDIKKIYRN